MLYQKLESIDKFLKRNIAPESFCSSIAIIDDLESNRSFLQHLAQRLPCVRYVSTFSSAIDALDAFSYASPDLVITDFNMPGMNAVEFLEKFRQMPELEDVPVIVVSTHNETDNRHRALLAGATDFLMVPFDTFEFQARTCNLLKLSIHQKRLRTQSISLRSQLQETRYRSIEAEHRFTSIIDSVPALVLAVDRDGACVFANQYCFDFLGISPDGGASAMQPLADKVLPDKSRISGSARLRPEEITLEGKDGDEHVFLMVPKAVKADSQATDFIVYSGIEITQLKETEHSLRGAKEAAEVANRAKSAFLSNMTHEIRTPLNAIMGFTDVMCNELHGPIGDERYIDYLRDVQTSAKHLLALVNEVIDFSQIEARRHIVDLSTFDLRTCLGAVVRNAKSQIKARGNRLVLNNIPGIHLRSDRQILSQILLNVVLNANKSMSRGAIRVSAKRAKSGDLIIVVKDNGIGMTSEEVVLAVTEFGRAMTSAFVSGGDGGTGLSLPLSIRFMKLLGGDLEIESEKGVGSVVNISLPKTAIVRMPTRKKRALRSAKLKAKIDASGRGGG